jgi:flavin-dependent dehydrogenase
VTALDIQPQHLTICTARATWHSRYIALAEGAKGTLRRHLGFTAVMPHDLGLDLDVAAGAACPWIPDTLYIDWGTRPQSYAWAFPKADHWSIGVKGPAPQSRTLVQYLRRFMARWHLQSNSAPLRYLAHMLLTRAPGMPLVRGCALVIGDAAGLLEPFTGEGIYYAVRSAHLAAEAIELASLHNASPVAYEAAVEAEIMPELSGAQALQQIFDAYPWLFHSLVRCHQRSWRTLAKILRGERGFADVERVLRRYPTVLRLTLWTQRGVLYPSAVRR